ncbi:helicase-associated domain-containing protein [Skermania piniformis]|uniref:Helicase-associated domain-containing protein n=1 Tax=Skermania pinensis TaxID=39122 RepID=A0ABX8S8S8_9ACTN|nr:helicase-associated domain-containing protein [Skermania piniformis]QXQ13399.1 helicase-associated domain-containing protein [Skermania piniformis]
MTAAAQDTGRLADWLSARSDDQLAALLQLRPDLGVPVPGTMDVLAARAGQRPSVVRSADDLDTVALTVLEALALLDAVHRPVSRAQVHELLDRRATPAAVDEALDQLIDRALAWGDDTVEVVAAAPDALPWPVGASFEPATGPDEAEIRAALAELDEPARTLLDRLATSSPIGRTRDAAPGTPADRPVQQLLARSLLTWLDEQTVALPQQVGQVLRNEPVTDPDSLIAPVATPERHRIADVDGVAAGEVLELLRHCVETVAALGRAPAPTLRAGGLGVRELRRIGKVAGLPEDRMSLLVELLAGANLIGCGQPEPGPERNPGGTGPDDYWAPTAAADVWLAAPAAARWGTLAQAWLELPRRPWLVGMRDVNDKPIAALSDEIRTAAAPRDRRTVLKLLAEFDPGAEVSAETLARIIAWRRPRRRHRFTPAMVAATLAEASALGVLGRGALSTPGRALLTGTDAEAAMASALPQPVDYVLVQADLTIVAPGPLVPELADRIAAVADVESAGAATVYRIGEASVRRALDGGASATELHALFGTHSRTPVPQALTYLIDDVARRHGRLRAGIAGAFLRCDDPAVLAEVLNAPVAEALALRALAPTVAVAQAPLAEVLTQLREAGFAPAGEDSSGTIIDLRPTGARVATRRQRPQLRLPTEPSPAQIAGIVRELRAGDRAAKTRHGTDVRPDGSRAVGAAAVALLQLAVRTKQAVRIAYVDAHGAATQRIVEPVRVGGGQLDAFDPATEAVRHFTLHRILSVSLVE